MGLDCSNVITQADLDYIIAVHRLQNRFLFITENDARSLVGNLTPQGLTRLWSPDDVRYALGLIKLKEIEAYRHSYEANYFKG